MFAPVRMSKYDDFANDLIKMKIFTPRPSSQRYSRRNSSRNPGRAPYPHIGLYILLLAIEPYRSGEPAYHLLVVSISMSIHKCEKDREHARVFEDTLTLPR